MLVVCDLKQSCNDPSTSKTDWSVTRTKIQWLGLGIISSMGLFTRFTFVFFAAPAILVMFHCRGRQCVKDHSRRGTTTTIQRSSSSTGIYLGSILKSVCWMLVSFLFTSFVIIAADSKFYVSQQHGVLSKYYFLTPWNAFRYNSNVGNLSTHGLHPRVTHAFVNMPLLYGPLAILFYLSSPFLLSWKHEKSNKHESLRRDVDTICYGVLTMGLGVLSCAPHQEPRFLLPLLSPLVLTQARHFTNNAKLRSRLVSFWLFFNAILGLFFGYLHQGQVVPSLLTLPSMTQSQIKTGGPSTNFVIYFHTYLPPTFLMRVGDAGFHSKDACYSSELSSGVCINSYENECSRIPTIDLQGSPLSSLTLLLDEILDCKDNGNKINERSVLLISPHAALNSSDEEINRNDKYELVELWSSFQVATEDIPTFSFDSGFISSLELGIFRLTCK